MQSGTQGWSELIDWGVDRMNRGQTKLELRIESIEFTTD
jgi:hypothetical protein